MEAKDFWDNIQHKFHEEPQYMTFCQLLGSNTKGEINRYGLLIVLKDKIVFESIDNTQRFLGIPMDKKEKLTPMELVAHREEIIHHGITLRKLAVSALNLSTTTPPLLPSPGFFDIFSEKTSYFSFKDGGKWFFEVPSKKELDKKLT